jgi:hypothetical protein
MMQIQKVCYEDCRIRNNTSSATFIFIFFIFLYECGIDYMLPFIVVILMMK